MKIRTDFVTNSSSSSFCVEVEIETEDFSTYTFKTSPNEYGTNSDLNCSIEQLQNVKDVDELCDLLYSSMKGTGKSKMKSFTSKLSKEINSIEDITSVVLRRVWYAYGEAASCHLKNDAVFMNLAKKVVEADKNNLEAALDEFEKYIETTEVYAEGGWSDNWPTNFCDSQAIPRYKYGSKVKSSLALAKKVIKEKGYGDDDLAVETIAIDKKNNTVTKTAEFIIYGDKKDIGKKDSDRCIEYLRKIFCKYFSSYHIQENVSVDSLISNYEKPCALIDFVLFESEVAKVAVSLKTSNNARSKEFKEIANVCENASVPYVCLDEKKDLDESKIVFKINDVLLCEKFNKYVVDKKIDESKWIEMKDSGEGCVVKVKCADGRAFEYACYDEFSIGDIVYVKSSRPDPVGLILSADRCKSVDGKFPVLKRLDV